MEALFRSFSGTFFLRVHEEPFWRKGKPVRVFFEHLDAKELLAEGLAKEFEGRKQSETET